ncbi:MAG: tetratricopeptide repeat-containing glycosyltransferase family protein [Gammaproteobacteria bacterium]|nr:tetratricopeptide repeat-containing glycosyltransferase family protein [Gammaproteobacteria bacterium]MDH5514123.1 tetratricopeptide repeat-containing glycosyltransferase family protein [Gammaproteobacteria bacterium]
MPQSQQLTIKQALSQAKKATRQGDTATALHIYNAVLQHQPDNPVAKKGLRNLQKGLPRNQYIQAETTKHLQDQISALENLYHTGQMEKTEQACRKLLRTYPHALTVINVLGVALRRQGKLEESVQAFDKAIELEPDAAEAYCNRGNALQDLGQLKSAVESYDKAIKLKPDYAMAYDNRGNALNGLGQLEAALGSYDKAIELEPDTAETYNNRGNVLKDLGQLESAMESYDTAIGLKPDYAEAYNNRGNALKEQAQLKVAVENYDKAIRLKPDYAEAHSNLSYALLSLGNFKDGWKEHEWRAGAKGFKSGRRNYVQPQWDGSSLDGKTILLHVEQGVGDEVMFSSCIPYLVDRNPKQIILECDLRLAPLFARSFPEVEVRGKKGVNNLDWLKEFGDIDFQVAIGSLPGFFCSDFELLPDRKPFLKPAPESLAKWKGRYADMGEGRKIGVSWRGGLERTKRIRSIELQLLEPVFRSGAHFVNLQYGDCAQEINQLEREMGVHIHDWGDADPLVDLDDFAAQVAALDLVISVDNSTVHFAGAVGTPAWVLLPFSPDWRWMLERDDSPWYPSIRLFRQKVPGDWSCVISEVKTELNKYCRIYGHT